MITRLLILAALAAVIMLVWALLRLRQRQRLHALVADRPFADLVPAGSPAIIAFTLPGCAECRARQAPALERLRARLGPAIPIVTLPADAHPALVARLGLLTLPATAVLDASGSVRYLNQGFAGEAQLAEQAASVAR